MSRKRMILALPNLPFSEDAQNVFPLILVSFLSLPGSESDEDPTELSSDDDQPESDQQANHAKGKKSIKGIVLLICDHINVKTGRPVIYVHCIPGMTILNIYINT